MKEKGINYWPSSGPLIHWRFGVLSAMVLLGMVVVWSIDGCTVKTFLEAWKSQQDFVTKVSTGVQPTANYSTKSNGGSVDHYQNSSELSQPVFKINQTHLSSDSPTNPPPKTLIEPRKTLPTLADWARAELEPNVTSNLISRWLSPGGEPCRDSKTAEILIPGLDGSSIELPAGEAREFVFHALDENGTRRCLGGDYFETDLTGESWKSRPPVKDFGDGSYSLTLQVHPDFAGDYNLTVILLYRHFEGLRFSPSRFVLDLKLRKIRLRFTNGSGRALPRIEPCGRSDFTRDLWAGRWTRLAKKEDCPIGADGRFRCLEPSLPCSGSWCKGPLGSLESNGWVYSTHCSFRIFESDPAWDCLKDRWIFFWGDSNHVDTIRNLLNFVLGRPDVAAVPRRFDTNFTNPRDPSQSVRITSIFNGHWNETMNYQGLNSLQNEGFRELVRSYFSGETVPDTVVINSGLHDGIFWRTLRAFANGAQFAAKFWAEVLGSVRERGMRPPRVVFRSTITTAGYARAMAFNPSKMEAFNWVFLESLKKEGLVSGVIDDFDMTFPWHFDNRCNDGVHYGRAPAKMRWRDGEIGHQYFVDLMLAHVILNAICPK